MASVRVHRRIAAAPDAVWKVVSDAGAVADWFDAIATSSVSGSRRTVQLVNGPVLTEDILTNDPVLRRFQYAVRDGLPLTSHLGTIDVLEDPAGSLVLYSTDVTPDEAGSMMAGLLDDALDGLERFVLARSTPPVAGPPTG
ncbi:MAG: SRPBCC family protein [Sporichthyaceae bacterium]